MESSRNLSYALPVDAYGGETAVTFARCQCRWCYDLSPQSPGSSCFSFHLFHSPTHFRFRSHYIVFFISFSLLLTFSLSLSLSISSLLSLFLSVPPLPYRSPLFIFHSISFFSISVILLHTPSLSLFLSLFLYLPIYFNHSISLSLTPSPPFSRYLTLKLSLSDFFCLSVYKHVCDRRLSPLFRP